MLFYTKHQNSMNRIVAYALALCLLLMLIFSESFLADHIHHNCTGEDCPICAEMHVADGMIRTIGAAVITSAIIIMALSFAFLESKVVTLVTWTKTPVKLKVRMDD